MYYCENVLFLDKCWRKHFEFFFVWAHLLRDESVINKCLQFVISTFQGILLFYWIEIETKNECCLFRQLSWFTTVIFEIDNRFVAGQPVQKIGIVAGGDYLHFVSFLFKEARQSQRGPKSVGIRLEMSDNDGALRAVNQGFESLDVFHRRGKNEDKVGWLQCPGLILLRPKSLTILYGRKQNVHHD